MQKLLTIVVPVYKVEQYINKCLDSCIIHKTDAQGQQVVDEETMDKLEVVIVNDGTPDNSAELSREYTKRFPNTFRQIDKDNGGHGSAWNVGLKEATGKYIRFLDSDDWLTNLDKLMANLQDCEADIVLTNFYKYYVQDNLYELQTVEANFGVMMPLSKDFLYSQLQESFVLNFWRTTYRTNILQPQYPLFAEKVMYDDSILALAPLLYGKTFVAYDFVVYNYLLGRVGQTMDETVQIKNIKSYLICYQRLLDWKSKYQEETPEEFHKCISDFISRYARIIWEKSIHMPYSESKKLMKRFHTEGYVIGNQTRGKMAKRYEKYPFFVFYFMERLRLFKKKQK